MKAKFYHLFIVLTVLAGSQPAAAQGKTAFTYQGQLHDGGTNANGTYLMIFKLYDAGSGGNLVGGPLTNSVTLANGLFSVNLDFGSAFNGGGRWLDITVTNGGTTETLSSRVQLLPSPYAIYSGSAGSVGNGAWSLGVGNYQVPNGGPLLTSNLIFSQQGVVQAILPTSSAGVGMFVNGTLICTTNSADTLEINGSATISGNSTSSGMVINPAGPLIVSSSNVNISAAGDISTTGGISTTGDVLVGGKLVNGIPRMQIFTTSTNFVVPAGITRIMVEMWGGGGGGGGNGPTSVLGVQYYTPGGGGGAGGYSIGALPVSPGTSYTVTIGAGGSASSGSGGSGGTTSFGGLLLAEGGGGGIGGTAGLNNGSVSYYYGGGGNAGYGTFAGGAGQLGGSNGGGGSSMRGGTGGWSGASPAGTSPGGGGGGASGLVGNAAGTGAPGAMFIYY